MRWNGWFRAPIGAEDVEEARCEAHRALMDAQNFDRRAAKVEAQAEQTRKRNHIAEAIELAVKPRSGGPA